jgi:tetratricopeptide (TPR) repeat protein
LQPVGEEDRNTFEFRRQLAVAYRQAGQPERAERVLNEALERLDNAPQEFRAYLRHVLHQELGAALVAMGQFVRAEQMIRAEFPEIPQGSYQWDQPRRFLAAALIGQRRFAEAEAILLKSFDGTKTPPPGLQPALHITWRREILQALVECYTAWERPEEVAKWKVELAKLPK